MAWVLLLAAGFLEVVWAFTIKHSQGFTRVGPTVLTMLALWLGASHDIDEYDTTYRGRS